MVIIIIIVNPVIVIAKAHGPAIFRFEPSKKQTASFLQFQRTYAHHKSSYQNNKTRNSLVLLRDELIIKTCVCVQVNMEVKFLSLLASIFILSLTHRAFLTQSFLEWLANRCGGVNEPSWRTQHQMDL